MSDENGLARGLYVLIIGFFLVAFLCIVGSGVDTSSITVL